MSRYWCMMGIFICVANFIIIYCDEGIMSNRLHLGTGDVRPFPPFFVCLQDTYHSTMCGFLSVKRCLLFFVCPWTLLFAWCMVSCHVAPCPPSLLVPNYLPALTVTALPCSHYLIWQTAGSIWSPHYGFDPGSLLAEHARKPLRVSVSSSGKWG